MKAKFNDATELQIQSADLIRKEEKSIENVPESIREQVREILAGEG